MFGGVPVHVQEMTGEFVVRGVERLLTMDPIHGGAIGAIADGAVAIASGANIARAPRDIRARLPVGG